MYAKPLLRNLDLTTAEAGCCRVIVNREEVVNTGICPFPTCNFEGTPCSVSAGPVTVSGT